MPMAAFDFLGAIVDLMSLVFDKQYRKTVLVVFATILVSLGVAMLVYYVLTGVVS